jgi:hypothetical protein
VDEAPYRLSAGDARADEDGRHDGQTGAALRYLGAQSERDPERHRGQGVTEVVDHVGQEGDAAAGDEYGSLRDRGGPEDRE